MVPKPKEGGAAQKEEQDGQCEISAHPLDFMSMLLLKRRQFRATEFVFFVINFGVIYIANES